MRFRLILAAFGLVAQTSFVLAGPLPDLAAPAAESPVSFRRQIVPVLTVAGCNQGACHGTPSGKNGFKLSLRGFDPAADYLQLTRDLSGRRINIAEPDKSLVLLKGRNKLTHEGGLRLPEGSPEDNLFRAWIAGGAKDDPADLPVLKKLTATPAQEVLNIPVRARQIAVTATFADGTSADVTRLSVFKSSDEKIAKVSHEGLVSFLGTGEVAVQVRYQQESIAVRLTFVETAKDFVWPNPKPFNYVDEHLQAKQKLLGIVPSELTGDTEYLRRVYLDLIAVPPTPAEVEAFIADSRPNKRKLVVESLLNRSEFADYWAFKWADVLTINRRAVQAKGAYLYVQWLRTHLSNNTPFDKVVRELITSSGSTFLNPPASYFRNDRRSRPANDIAQNTAQLFLGIRMSCAQCHNHPFERWTQDDYYGLSAFFARVKDRPDPLYPRLNRFNLGAIEIYNAKSGEVIHPRTKEAMPPRFLGGEIPEIKPDQDRREVLAEWLTRKDNPFFAKAAVNRIWYHLLGRGIVDAVDDFRDTNPSASDELLNQLAKDFTDHDFDIRHVIRVITESRTYQLSAATNKWNSGDDRFFSHAVTKLYPAEVLLDSLSAATEVPESFEGTQIGTRAIQLPDGDAFQHPFLKAFGQPARETTCECERQGDSSLGHALQLINGPTLKSKLSHGKNRIARLIEQKKLDPEIVRELYLATLARRPTPNEERESLDFVGAAENRRAAFEDLQWALFNSKEFLYRH